MFQKSPHLRHIAIRTITYFMYVFSLIASTVVVAQVPEEPVQDLLLEDVVESTETEFDFDTYTEYLEILQTDPLNLNTASITELQELRLLSDQQISALVQYRRRFGDLLTPYELQAVPFFNLETIAQLMPFTTVDADRERTFRWRNVWRYNRQQLFLRYQRILEPQLGYTLPDTVDRQRYLGRPERLYMRYQFRYSRNVSAGFTLEKDPGEPFLDTIQRGPDFASFHAYVQDIGKLKALAIGDYAINFGQGLVVWSGFGFNKSPYPLQVKRNSFTVRPYTSVNEALYFRGGAATYAIAPKINATAFVSRKAVDGNVDDIDTLENEVLGFTSLQITGYHRTPNELADKDAIQEWVTGGELKYEGEYIDIGLTAAHTRLDADLTPTQRPYSQFRFNGDALTSIGLHYTGLYRNILLFGETAHSLGSGWATLNGITFNLDHKTAFSAVFRHYDKDYQSLYSNAFGESTTVENETGIYLGLSTELSRKLRLSGFVDLYRHPWLRFRSDAPSHGVEYLGQLTYNLGWGSEVYFRARHEVKWQNRSQNETAMDYLVPTARSELRLHLAKDVNRQLSIRSRLVYSIFNDGEDLREEGYMLYQDVRYDFQKLPLSLSTRFALFDTESFNTRIYAYEQDVLYSFSIPAYNGEGARWYVLLNWEPTEFIEAWVRVAQFRFPYAETIGSGLNQIEGNRQTEIKAQLRFRW